MSTNMDLSILKLVSPHRRSVHATRFTSENDPAYGTTNDSIYSGGFTLISPRGGTPASPVWSGSSRIIVDDGIFTIFKHQAAIPFKWEEIPGLPIAGAEEEETVTAKICAIDLYDPPSVVSHSTSSSSSSNDYASGKVEDELPEFEFTSICSSNPASSATEEKKDALTSSNKHADELFPKGQILPLKPPPGMQSIRQLMTLESEDRGKLNFSNRSLSNLITSAPAIPRRSFRRDGLKALPFLASPRREPHHNEEFLSTMLGFDERPKNMQMHSKENSYEEEDGEHRRTRRLSFSFRKKSATEKDISSFDVDDIFDEDFGKKGGLRERKTLTSVCSRGIADGHSYKSKSWIFDSSVDYSDSETDSRSEYFGSVRAIAEGDEQDEQTLKGEAPVEKKKEHALSRLSRLFTSSQSNHQKPPRSSSVAPAPPPPLAPTLSELKKLRRASQQRQATNPILKMWLSNPARRALFKNVKQLRSFEFHNPLAAK